MRLYQVGNHETTDFLDPTTLPKAIGQLHDRLNNQHAKFFEVKKKEGIWRAKRGIVRTLTQVAHLVYQARLGEAVWVRDTKNEDPLFVIRPVIVKVEDFPENQTYTAAAKRCWYDVMIQFDGLVSWGIFVCKRILGTSDWSQHSWGNAIDFHGSPERMKALAEYLKNNAKRLNIANVIHDHKISYNGGAWQSYGGSNPHTDHVHVDFFPEKTGTPPCA